MAINYRMNRLVNLLIIYVINNGIVTAWVYSSGRSTQAPVLMDMRANYRIFEAITLILVRFLRRVDVDALTFLNPTSRSLLVQGTWRSSPSQRCFLHVRFQHTIRPFLDPASSPFPKIVFTNSFLATLNTRKWFKKELNKTEPLSLILGPLHFAGPVTMSDPVANALSNTIDISPMVLQWAICSFKPTLIVLLESRDETTVADRVA